MSAFVSAQPFPVTIRHQTTSTCMRRTSFHPTFPISTGLSLTPSNCRPQVHMCADEEPRENLSLVEETKLFVGNLSWNTTNESLQAAFSQYGTVLEARVIFDRETGRSRGYGFIEYKDPSSAEEALVGMNGVEVDGRNIRVDRANRSTRRRPNNYY